MSELTYCIKEGKLKSLGYTFQKLYADDRKAYHKKIGRYKIWLWVAGKTIEIEDWYEHSAAIINFYKENKNHSDFEKGNIKIQLNPENGHVQLFDQETYAEVFQLHHKGVEDCWSKWNAKYENWYNEIYIVKDHFEQILKEIQNLNDCN